MNQEVKIRISAPSAPLAADMQKNRQAVETNIGGMQRAIEGARRGFGEAMASVKFMAAAAAAGGAAAFAMVIRQAIETADNMGKMAQSIGVPVESLSTLAYAAKLSGVEIDKLQTSLGRLSRNMTDAASGTGEAKDAFVALGININDANGRIKSNEQVLKEVADRFKGMQDGAVKTGLAMKIFGRSGAELVPLLNQGSDAIGQLQDKARELGLEITTKTAKAAEEFNDRVTELKATASGFGIAIASDMLPKLNEIIRVMAEANKESGKLLALWMGFGGAMTMVFTDELESTEFHLKKARIELEQYQRAMKTWGSDPEQAKRLQEDIKATEAKIAKLEKVLEREKEVAAAKADQARKNKTAQDTLTAQIEDELRKQKAREEAAKKAAAEAERSKKAGEAAILDLRRELELLGEKTEVEKVLWELEKGKYADLSPAHKERIRMLAEEVEEKKKLIKASEDALEQLKKEVNEGTQASEAGINKLIQSAQRIIEQTRHPMEAYADTIRDLKKLLDLELISPEIYGRAASSALDTMNKSLEDTDKGFKDLQRTIEGWGQQSAQAIVDFALTGKASFGDMIQSMIADMLQMLLYQQIMQPLFSAVGSGVGGVIKGILPSGNRATGGPVSPGKMYEVNERGMPELLNVGNRQFLMMADQSGHVTPAGSGSSGGGYGGGGTGEVTVNIINKNGSEVSTQQKESPQGIEIDVMIDQAVAKKLGQFGSKSNKTLKSTYGARERLVSR